MATEDQRRWVRNTGKVAVSRSRATVLAARNVLSARDYPQQVAVAGPNQETLDFIGQTKCLRIAELGIYRGDTSRGLASYLNHEGELHLFDFDDRVQSVLADLRHRGYSNVIGHPNSHRTHDSYNWSLMQVLKANAVPCFDYVLIDGAHTWGHDALAFLLIDRLLAVGGYVDFDDYAWSLGESPSLNPQVFPKTRRDYTDEQIAAAQVALVVELLVRRDPNYVEVVTNKIFQKVG